MAPGRPASAPAARLLQHLQPLHAASEKPAPKKKKKRRLGRWRPRGRRERAGRGEGAGGARCRVGERRRESSKFYGTSAGRTAPTPAPPSRSPPAPGFFGSGSGPHKLQGARDERGKRRPRKWGGPSLRTVSPQWKVPLAPKVWSVAAPPPPPPATAASSPSGHPPVFSVTPVDENPKSLQIEGLQGGYQRKGIEEGGVECHRHSLPPPPHPAPPAPLPPPSLPQWDWAAVQPWTVLWSLAHPRPSPSQRRPPGRSLSGWDIGRCGF